MLTLTLLSALAFAEPTPPAEPAAETTVAETTAEATPPEATEAEGVDLDGPAAPAARAVIPPRFMGGEGVSLSGELNDVFAAGEQVRVEVPVGDNAFLAGNTITVDETIHGDLFAAGEYVTINAPVLGDVYAAGSEVRVSPEGRVDGHLSVGAGKLKIEGPVGGGVSAGVGQLIIGAPVAGDVDLEAGELLFTAAGSVGGDLTYTTPEVSEGAEDAVAGVVSWEQREEGEHDAGEADSGGSPLGWALWTLYSFLAKLIAGAALLTLGGAAAAGAGRRLLDQPPQSLGAGLAVFVGLPVLSILACALILPLPLGVLGLMLFAALLFVAQLVTAQALGDQVLRRLQPDAKGTPLVSMAVGLVPLALLTSLPWVGALAWFVATVLGMGAIWLQLRALARA